MRTNMKIIVIIFCLFLESYSKNSNICPGIKPFGRTRTSAIGRWHLTKAIPIGNNTQAKNTCGFFNTVKPCKCIGVNMNSTGRTPYLHSYTLQNFGYNSKYNMYAVTSIELTMVSNMSIFNAFVPLANLNFTLAIVGTDDYRSWISFVMCDELKGPQGSSSLLKWIITRSPFPSSEVILEAVNSLKKSLNLTPNLISVDQSNCPPIL